MTTPARSDIVIVGGSEDGRRMTLSESPPPAVLRLPVEEPVSARIFCEDEGSTSLKIAEYQPIFNEHGRHSRADDGAWRYRPRP